MTMPKLFLGYHCITWNILKTLKNCDICSWTTEWANSISRRREVVISCRKRRLLLLLNVNANRCYNIWEVKGKNETNPGLLLRFTNHSLHIRQISLSHLELETLTRWYIRPMICTKNEMHILFVRFSEVNKKKRWTTRLTNFPTHLKMASAALLHFSNNCLLYTVNVS